MSCCSPTSSRRTFLTAGGVATAAVALAACSSGSEQDVFSDGELTEAIALEQLPPGASVQLAVGANHVLIYRESENTVHAYSAVCTHQGCMVGAGDNDTDAFVCPCHASNFDKTTGEAIAGPAQLPLTRHKASIANGWILVAVDPV